MPTNRLINEKSPYLLQHAHNPVDWHAWGNEAFDKARRENKPIFLSIGYSTCHWCHVMERESFESEEVASVLNRYFVPVKVDREERPDVDRIYMTFVQATTGSGGWPMSIWLTPELEPFFGGTYFPPDDRYGRPGFKAVLEHIAQAWTSERERVKQSGANVVAQLRKHAEGESVRAAIDERSLEHCFYLLRRGFDSRHGGFGDAPKFPRPVVHNFLHRYWEATGNQEALDMSLFTLKAMARGGMNDQLGGGFHRYSVDERWFVPHFEKMLYDQAQLAVSYLEAHQISREEVFASVARDIFEYVLRDMTHPEGGFYSAEDADSIIDPSNPRDKGEGAFYIWSYEEIERILGPQEAARFADWYGVERGGNVGNDPHGEFTGKNILYQARAGDYPADLNSSRRKLFAARAARPRPHLDDKILTGWNALMISAFAKGAQILNEHRYADAANRAASFIYKYMFQPGQGTLLRRFREGDAAIPAFLDDYAYLANALVDLYETTFALHHLETAVRLAEKMIELFEDRENGAFYSTAEGDDSLVMRMKEDYDGAEPSGNSMAALALLRLAELSGRDDFRRSAGRALEAFAQRMNAAPIGVPQMLVAYMWSRAPRKQIILAGDRTAEPMRAMMREIHQRFLPGRVLMLLDSPASRRFFSAHHAAVESMAAPNGQPTAYICENFACQLPATDPATVAQLLESRA